MLKRWTKGLDETAKKEMQAQLLASSNILGRLEKLVLEDIVASKKSQASKESYESPSWAYLQADSTGEIRAYNKILKLINLKESK